MKVAIIHDWLVSQRGGENVLDAICELFPHADLFTLVYSPGKVSPNILRLNRHTSILQRIPAADRRYRHFLPLMPWAIQRFDLEEYDLIISSSHCVAKGIQKSNKAFHVSYVHAPMRYMWDRFDDYFSEERSGLITRTAARFFRPYLQKWDMQSATRVDSFIANSNFIKDKIKTYYNREAQVIYPFCEPENFTKRREPGRNYLLVSALVPYKRVDLAIEVFNKMKKPLLIVGDGPDRERLKKMGGPTIEFFSGLKRGTIADMYSKCRALIFPGIEDFGIVPLEAMAAGAPVIAYGQGGALETVTDRTGVFFDEPTVDSMIQAIQRFEVQEFLEKDCRARGRSFSRYRFQTEFSKFLEDQIPSRIWSSLEIPDIVVQPSLA